MEDGGIANPPAPKAGALPGCATPRHLKLLRSKTLSRAQPYPDAAPEGPYCAKTVPEPHQLTVSVPKPGPDSLARRFNFVAISAFTNRIRPSTVFSGSGQLVGIPRIGRVYQKYAVTIVGGPGVSSTIFV